MDDKEIKVAESAARDTSYLLPLSIIVAGLMISGSVIYLVASQKGANPNPAPGQSGQTNPDNTASASLKSALALNSNDVVLGDPKALVTLIEYGDYQCPFCGRFFTNVESQLKQNYINQGKVKMVFRNFAFLGPESLSAAEATACSNDQSKFWSYHDALYEAEVKDGVENNGNLNRALFVKLAGNLGLNTSTFSQCYDSGKYKSAVEKEAADAKAVGVNSTPTTFINNQELIGALPYAQFTSVIDSFLKAK